MGGNLLGYAILLIFATILILISMFINKNNQLSKVDELLTAGRGMPFGFIAASVFVAWVWSGSLMGAGEAGIRSEERRVGKERRCGRDRSSEGEWRNARGDRT